MNLLRVGGEQLGEEYRNINPQGLVPVLLHEGHVLTQSMAICEYLDEVFPQYPLLPDDTAERAHVRSLALQIACEIHPVNNLRVQKYLRSKGGDASDSLEWMSHWMTVGFTAIEKQLDRRNHGAPGYTGEEPGLFECFLVPQVYNAERYGIDISSFAGIRKIVAHCRALPAFSDAAPENQPDAVPD